MIQHIEDFMIGRVLQLRELLQPDEKIIIINGMVMVRKKSWLDRLRKYFIKTRRF